MSYFYNTCHTFKFVLYLLVFDSVRVIREMGNRFTVVLLRDINPCKSEKKTLNK